MSALSESRGRVASAEAHGLQRRMVAAGPIVAVVSMVAALIATGAAGIPLRDPDHVAGRRLVMLLALVALLVALDVVVRASRRAPGLVPSRALVALLVALDVVARASRRAPGLVPTRAHIADVRRERWTWRRGAVVATALVSFYASYFAYRNLKSVVPLLRIARVLGVTVEELVK